ncbi:TlpA family protein disulfide reductase [Thiothrix nivea]|uniref:Redoxin domain protein n=1 Tax=Thiothrix nivea (strain ATCC 35100 / DSM 5205 / JP2) TaxID=870187 RepID=A0A656HGF6_THINJ|nr:TlpA disulfide reductase family protein [Thiothrix nivea]EIJ35988.1 Redoxin domain protein [Thiothrix nivea DSM 5205]
MKLDIKGIAILAFIAGIAAFFLLAPAGGVKTVPAATVQTIDGTTLSLDSLKGKPYLLTFWSTTCPGCVGEIPVLEALENKMQGSGFRIIAVAMSYDEPPAIKAMRVQKGMTYTVAHDQSGELAKQFDVRVTPTSFLVGADGKIAVQKMGEWDATELEQKVNELMKG